MSVHARIVLEVELPGSKRSRRDDDRHLRALASSVAAWAARNRWVTRARLVTLEREDSWHGPRDLLTNRLRQPFGEPIPEPDPDEREVAS